MRQALATYRDLATKRMKQFEAADKSPGSQEKIQKHDTDISDIITQTGDYERIPF
jgi:hypothetical protein